MTDELKNIIAATFRVSDGSPLSDQEMANILAFKLKYFDPSASRLAIDAAKSSGFLKTLDNNHMTPTFDIGSLELPPDYRPPDDLDVRKLSKPLVERLIDTIMESGMEKQEVARAINKASETYNLLFPAAAVFVGLEKGLDMSPFFGEVENFVLHGKG